jgi:hypothetical protein
MVTTASSGEPFRRVGSEFHNRAGALQKLLAEAPRQIWLLRGYGDFLFYAADEIDRATSIGIDLSSSPGFNTLRIEQTLSWGVPSPSDIGLTFSATSGTTNLASELMVTWAVKQPDLQLFQNPPETFLSIQTTDETIQNLNTLKPGLGDTWQAAWNATAVGNVESVKTVAVNARTVVDQISWMPDYEHLKTLAWCKLDQKDEPIRATRYAWILHGDNLPEELNNDPSNDPVWKTFGQAYRQLQEYVKVPVVSTASVLYVENCLKTIQVGLEQYLREGFERLSP